MKTRKPSRINRRGTSLITALLAMVIMAVGVLGVAQVFLRAMQSNGSAGGVTGLMNLAQMVQERVMLLADNDPLLRGTSLLDANLGLNQNPSQPDYDTRLYSYTCSLDQDLPAGTADHLVRIVISARYTANYAGYLGVVPADSEVRVVSYRYYE